MTERKINESLNSSSPLFSRHSSSDIEILDGNLNNDSNDNIRSNSTKISSSSFISDDQFISQIIELLDLDDDSTDSKMLVRQLLINGRQDLSKYEDDIAPNIYKIQMNTDDSQLLSILKNYIEQQWQLNTEEWFQTFLKKQKIESSAVYDQILARTAEHGTKYLKDNPSLSLILQFLFEFDDLTLQNEEIFDNILKTLAINGLEGLKKYSEDLAPIVITEQCENDTSPLSLALREYFRQPLLDLLNKINKSSMIEIFLNCVTKYGWQNGLNQTEVQQRLAPNKSKILMKELEQYLIDKNLNFVNSNTNITQSPENSTLINSSLSSIPEQNISSSMLPTTNNKIFSEPILTITSSVSDNNSYRQEQEDYLKKNDEITVIRMCTDGYEKWQLVHLVEAGELMYIDQKFDDVINMIVNEYYIQQNFTEFIKKSLQTIMYLLKRHQNLEDFTNNLFFKYFQAKLSKTAPKLNLRMIIHILLLKSDFSLSRIIMLLLSKRNPVPFIQPSINPNENYQFIPDIIHVWDYQTPTILSFGIGKCFGKSTLLNTIFMSSFEISKSSIYFQETIDIDFGYSFIPRRLTNIADTHGSISEKLFLKIFDLFDGFIIHIDYKYLQENLLILKNYVHIISQRLKYCLILVRDVPIDNREECSKFLNTIFSSTIQIFILPNISDSNKIENKYFILELNNMIFQTIPIKCFHEKKYIEIQLKNLFDQKSKEQLYEIYNIIIPLKEKLIDLVQNHQLVINYFPQYSIYAELCNLKLCLASFNFYGNENDKIVFDVRRKIFELENAFNKENQQCGIIFDLFIEILKSSNMLMCLDLLSIELKFQRLNLIPISELSKQLPIEKNLSLEILWRNMIVCEYQQNDNIKKFLYKQYYQYINAGYPFEIIDGDHFYFHQKFLIQSLEFFREKKTLVISIIGPQNSGKSTLLNYMFGTLFDVRDGRCTRGIYGSFVKSNHKDFDYIMLIDTEGLLGVEREDPEYDRRIVLFCLAVSHLVIVNMVGEANTALQTMLNLCTDSLRQMGVTRIPQPTVHFILNQKADLNNDNNQFAIDRIISDLKKQGPTIDIKTESFHTLPSAFKKSSNLTSNSKLPSVIKTESDFLERVQILSGELIKSAESVFSRSTEFSDPIQWIKSSYTIFETLQKFSDLTFYRDINERQQDNEIREYIREKLTKIFSSSYRNQLIEESINKTENEIIEIFHLKQNQIENLIHQDLDNLFKLLKASDIIRTRSKQFLNAQIIATFHALKTTCFVVNERKKIQLLVRDGEGDLRQLIDDTIQSGIILSSDIASEKFEIMFNNCIQHIQCKFIPDELVQNALKYIYTNYNIYEKEDLPNYQDILHSLSLLFNFNDSQLSVLELKDEFILAFTNLAYRKHQPIEIHSFTNDNINSYSFEQIENLIYLNKQLIDDSFIEYLNNRNPQLIQSQQQQQYHQSKNPLRQFWKSITSQFRENSHKKQQSSSSSQPIIYTADFLRDIRNAIKIEKPKINHANIEENHMILRLSIFIREIIEKIIKEMNGIEKNQIRQIQTELIQKIVGLIHTIIININNELKPFCLSLSRSLKSIFHICSISLLTTYYFNEQKKHFIQTLTELNEKKDDLKTYFLQMIVPNALIDINYAENFLKQFQNSFMKLFQSNGQKLINIHLQQYDYLNRKWIQNRCDGQLLINTNMIWLMDYILNPTNIIEQEFQKLWLNILEGINQKLIENKTNFYSLLTDYFFCLQGIADTIKRFRYSAATFIQDIFISEDNNSLNLNENLAQKKRCMAILLYYYMSGQKIPQKIVIKTTIPTNRSTTQNIEKKTYKLKQDVLELFHLLSEQRPPSEMLQTITKEMSIIYDRLSIDNLSAFLQHILDKKTDILNEFNEIQCDFNTIDEEDTYSRLLDKVRGCPNLCPCCKRPCDVDHTQIKSTPGSQYNEHRCTTGHALRAMNGYKFEINEEASLLMCEHIKDDQIIVIGSQRIKWSQFKLNHNDWNFVSTLNDDELNKLYGKFLTLWMKIGPELCQKYNMKYVIFNTIKQDYITYESFHWILLLDRSGSMAGKPWLDLLQAVNEFLTHRRALNTNDRITIIVFADEADDVCYNEDIQNVSIENIPLPQGRTSFSNAFARVNEVMKRAKDNSVTTSTTIATPVLNHAIIFMTDGEDDYPEKELNQLVNEHGAGTRFWTLALGHDFDSEAKKILEQINSKMNGSYYSLGASNELTRTFAEIANNTNSSNNNNDTIRQ